MFLECWYTALLRARMGIQGTAAIAPRVLSFTIGLTNMVQSTKSKLKLQRSKLPAGCGYSLLARMAPRGAVCLEFEG